MGDLSGIAHGRLITRGNLDGIACAAVFLNRYPEAGVRFVTSPPAAAREARSEDVPTIIADVPLTEELAAVLESSGDSAFLVDHHPTKLSSERAFIDLGKSAAGVLHAYLGHEAAVANIAALADLHERSESPLALVTTQKYGRERMMAEATALDLAWRHNVEDDSFRLEVARALSRGRWPTEVPSVVERSNKVRRGGKWARAVEAVAGGLEVRGGVGILDLRGKRLSLHGFGSVVLSEVANVRRCGYTLLLHGSDETATASVRSTGDGALDLGRFLEEFTAVHGIGGGGHARSAGARVPSSAADILIDHLVAAAC